jgi:hypothetical protein
MHMDRSGYLINLLLVASVLRQLRGRHLTWLGLSWPIAAVVWAAITYLRGFPAGGNNTALVVAGVIAGVVLGALCGWLSRVYSDSESRVIVRATGLAALMWTVGTGSRLAFEFFAEHGGYPQIEAFDRAHQIAGTRTWATCLILMALAEVLARTAFLAPRLWAEQRQERAAGIRPRHTS